LGGHLEVAKYLCEQSDKELLMTMDNVSVWNSGFTSFLYGAIVVIVTLIHDQGWVFTYYSIRVL
jgi:hypothetical protein